MKQLQTLLEWSMQNTTPDSMREYAQQVERGDRPKPSADLLTRGRVITEWDQLKACVTVLEVPEVQGPEVPERDRVDEEDRLRAMENLEYLVENLDNANDLVKLNGIALVQRYLVHSNPKLRAMAAKIFSTCASNNEKFVKQALEFGVPSSICQQLRTENDLDVLANLVGCLTSLCTDQSIRPIIVEALGDFVPILLSHSDSTRVITRTLYFLNSLVMGDPSEVPPLLLEGDLLSCVKPYLSTETEFVVLERALNLCESIVRRGGAKAVDSLQKHIAEEIHAVELPAPKVPGEEDEFSDARQYLSVLRMFLSPPS